MSTDCKTFVPQFLYIYVRAERDAKSVEKKIKESLSELIDVDFPMKVNLVFNRVADDANFAYVWVGSVAAYHLLMGKNPDGTKRGMRSLNPQSEEDQAQFPSQFGEMEKELAGLDVDYPWPTFDGKQKDWSWGDLQFEEDEITSKYQVVAEPLFEMPYEIFGLAHVKEKTMRGDRLVINPPPREPMPNWLTSDVIMCTIDPMIPDDVKKILYERKKKARDEFAHLIEERDRLTVQFPQNDRTAVGISAVSYKTVVNGPRGASCTLFMSLQPIRGLSSPVQRTLKY